MERDEVSKVRDGVKIFLFIVGIALLIADRCLSEDRPESDGPEFDRVAEVSDVMFDLLSPAPNRPLYRNHERRRRFASDVVTAADEAGVPEFLLVVQIFAESSFRKTAVATDRPTVGLGQIHVEGVASVGCDLSTRLGQLRCTANFLRFCFDHCSTNWTAALIAYATPGHCSSSVDRVRQSARRRVRQWKRFEEQRERIRAEILDDMESIAEWKNSTN